MTAANLCLEAVALEIDADFDVCISNIKSSLNFQHEK